MFLSCLSFFPSFALSFFISSFCLSLSFGCSFLVSFFHVGDVPASYVPVLQERSSPEERSGVAAVGLV